MKSKLYVRYSVCVVAKYCSCGTMHLISPKLSIDSRSGWRLPNPTPQMQTCCAANLCWRRLHTPLPQSQATGPWPTNFLFCAFQKYTNPKMAQGCADKYPDLTTDSLFERKGVKFCALYSALRCIRRQIKVICALRIEKGQTMTVALQHDGAPITSIHLIHNHLRNRTQSIDKSIVSWFISVAISVNNALGPRDLHALDNSAEAYSRLRFRCLGRQITRGIRNRWFA